MSQRNSASRETRGKTAYSPRARQHTRLRIAQRAAELILAHGLDDWQHAKRKAAKQLLLPDNDALPNDDEIEVALFERQTLFGANQLTPHTETLKEKRRQALIWMDRFSTFSPMLYGALAEGWGGEHQAIRLELIGDNPKAVEIKLIDLGFSYQIDAAEQKDSLRLRFHDHNHEIQLRIITSATRRQRKRGKTLLDRDALSALLC
ncbi:MAG: hypothetical protein LBS40_06835 [Burkholderiales bacterium]|jgi:hypothetical protein|nr:hypothetical protein [Burkholderiales bacterium]